MSIYTPSNQYQLHNKLNPFGKKRLLYNDNNFRFYKLIHLKFREDIIYDSKIENYRLKSSKSYTIAFRDKNYIEI